MSLKDVLLASKISDEMIERRDLVKRLNGSHYAERTSDARRIVQAIAKRDGIDILPAALRICENAIRDGHGSAVNVVIAAAVDLIEEGTT